MGFLELVVVAAVVLIVLKVVKASLKLMLSAAGIAVIVYILSNLIV